MWINLEVPDTAICVTATVIWNATWPDIKIANIAIPNNKLFDGAEFKIPPDVEET